MCWCSVHVLIQVSTRYWATCTYLSRHMYQICSGIEQGRDTITFGVEDRAQRFTHSSRIISRDKQHIQNTHITHIKHYRELAWYTAQIVQTTRIICRYITHHADHTDRPHMSHTDHRQQTIETTHITRHPHHTSQTYHTHPTHLSYCTHHTHAHRTHAS